MNFIKRNIPEMMPVKQWKWASYVHNDIEWHVSDQVDVLDCDELKEMIINAMMDSRVSGCLMLIADYLSNRRKKDKQLTVQKRSLK